MVYESWRYRKSHVITSVEDVDDYVVKITIHRSSGTDSGKDVYVGDKCQSDYRDIRFTNSSGTPLPFYIDKDKFDSTYADVWIDLDELRSSTTIYIYYGYASAQPASNGYNTFLFFADFTDYGSSAPRGLWNQQSGTRSCSSGSIALTSTSTSSNQGIYSGKSRTQNVFGWWPYKTRYYYRASVSGHTTTNISGFGFGFLNSQGAQFIYNTTGKIVAHSYRSAATKVDMMDVDTSVHDFEIHHISDSLIKFRIDGGSFTSITASTAVPLAASNQATFNTLLQNQTTSGTHPTITATFVFVAKTIDTEPTHSTWGSEETLTPAPIAGWLYKKKHTITNAGATLSNYQIRIDVHYGSGTDSGKDVYLDSKCRTDFADIRIGDVNRNMFPLAIESKANSDVAVFWVKIPQIASTTDIYLYYGKSTASSYNDPDETFAFHEFFDSATLNLKKFSDPSPYLDYTLADSAIKFIKNESGYGNTMLYTQYPMRINQMQRVRTKYGADPRTYTYQSTESIGMFYNSLTTGVNAIVLNINASSTNPAKVWFEKEQTNPAEYINTSLSTGSEMTDYHIFDIKWVSTGPNVKMNCEGTNIFDHTNATYIPVSSEIPSFAGAYWTEAGTKDMLRMWVDFIFIVQVAATEPVHSTWGSEEPAFTTAPFKSNYHLGFITAAFTTIYQLGEWAAFVSKYRIGTQTEFVSRYATKLSLPFTSIYRIIIGIGFKTEVRSDSSTQKSFRTRVESAQKTIAAMFEER